MKKLHFDEVGDGTPICGVFKKQHRETTTNLDLVDCRSCIRWEAYVRHDITLFARIYS